MVLLTFRLSSRNLLHPLSHKHACTCVLHVHVYCMCMCMYLSDGLLVGGVHESDGPVGGSQSHDLCCLDVLQRPSCGHLTNRLTDHTNSCRARGGTHAITCTLRLEMCAAHIPGIYTCTCMSYFSRQGSLDDIKVVLLVA